jgi:FtsZ-interacting cell division protein ZipA
MTTAAWVMLIIAIAAILIAVITAVRARHSKMLRSRFGPEYDHLVQERGNTARAEKEMEYRSKRVEKFNIRRLTLEECNGFAAEWRTTQERFVDDPRAAVAEADELVQRAMRARGYPVAADFEERAADLSVDHAAVVENYRAAHAIAIRDVRGRVSTEELRTAMKYYRALFEDLVDQRVSDYRPEFREVKR